MTQVLVNNADTDLSCTWDEPDSSAWTYSANLRDATLIAKGIWNVRPGHPADTATMSTCRSGQICKVFGRPVTLPRQGAPLPQSPATWQQSAAGARGNRLGRQTLQFVVTHFLKGRQADC